MVFLLLPQRKIRVEGRGPHESGGGGDEGHITGMAAFMLAAVWEEEEGRAGDLELVYGILVEFPCAVGSDCCRGGGGVSGGLRWLYGQMGKSVVGVRVVML